MPVCTIGASTKQRDEAGKIDERDWEIYSLVAPLGCREARTPVSGIQVPAYRPVPEFKLTCGDAH